MAYKPEDHSPKQLELFSEELDFVQEKEESDEERLNKCVELSVLLSDLDAWLSEKGF